ncbi:MAG: putative peptide zinc metalloprotease protein [Candidatus Eremiobacteraeota bacterium]|jgi:hypothetical protein|nr:putative peptide zinc metalloprotease protein [Candidatus Eremiobacteraeota bacterium]
MEMLQLRDDVRESVIDGTLMLQSRTDVRAVKVSRSASHLLPPLKNGATLDELCDVFGRRLSEAQRSQVSDFVGVLGRAGLLQSSAKASKGAMVRYATCDLSAPLSALGARLRASRALTTAAIAVLVVVMLAILAGAGAVLPHLAAIEHAIARPPISLLAGVIALFAIVIPLHELAHGVVAGACGIERTRFVLARRGFVPTVFCETPGSSLIPGRLLRVLVPAAGPLVDLGFVVLFGLLALHVTAFGSFFAAAACTSLIALVLDCNPYSGSDGSRILEILLDDDHARASALSRTSGVMSMRPSARIYLGVAIAYLATIVMLTGFFGIAVSRAGGV